jgi:SAM-dependent methyltransferase
MNYEPNAREKWNIVVNSYRMLGLGETLKGALAYLLEPSDNDTFDQRFGVSTSGSIEASNAGIEDELARSYAIRYAPTGERVMHYILRHALDGLDPSALTFVDLGCGKGRALIMAAHYPFREVIGVELSPEHSRAAEDNLRRLRFGQHPLQCRNLRVACANALEFDYPDSDLLIYMYRPFLAAVMHGVAERLSKFQRATGRRVRIAYACPIEEAVLEAHPAFRKVLECQVISLDASWNLWECSADATPDTVGVRNPNGNSPRRQTKPAPSPSENGA